MPRMQMLLPQQQKPLTNARLLILRRIRTRKQESPTTLETNGRQTKDKPNASPPPPSLLPWSHPPQQPQPRIIPRASIPTTMIHCPQRSRTVTLHLLLPNGIDDNATTRITTTTRIQPTTRMIRTQQQRNNRNHNKMTGNKPLESSQWFLWRP